METLKYTVIKNKKQYRRYCSLLEEFVCSENSARQDEAELLSLLIEKWDEEHSRQQELEPIPLLKTLMQEHELKARDLAEILKLSKSTVSKILNYHKGLSKETIRKLAVHFRLSQEAFNRPYSLAPEIGKNLRNTPA
ncbi:MAG: helix-turn-helix domain-containing protein [Cytophagales bacterium]|nr:helix-turn-helix domain-containing protein [Cytophagales bacterium]